MRLEEKFSRGINVIWVVQSCLQKYCGSLLTQISSTSSPSCPKEGRLEIVTDAGQDAVDAGCALTNALGSRTAKSCGPDASMVGVKLAMMAMSALSGPTRRHHAGDGDNKARSPGSAKETVKTIACGNAG
jgi:hypothetical protein